jgi:hypothetical protein
MPTFHERLKRRLQIIRLAVVSTLALAGLALLPGPVGCASWPGTRDDVVDCAKEAGKDVFASELVHLQELITKGVSYDSAASYAAGLVLRFGRPFVVCLWQRVQGQGGMFGNPSDKDRAVEYSTKWLAEYAHDSP